MNRLTNPSARPSLEALEDRDVPSTLAAEFPGHGVWSYASGTWTQLTAADASQVAADSHGDVVGEFPGQGVWLFKDGAWQQINGHDVASLAIAYSFLGTPASGTYTNIYVAAEFPGYGVCRYTDFTRTDPDVNANYHYTRGRH